jgi:subtilisin family serine protease
VPGHYIVVLKDEVPEPGGTAGEMARRHGLAIGHVFKAALKGFSAAIPAERLRAVENDPRVQRVEQDQIVMLVARKGGGGGGGGGTPPAQSLPTGIDRIDADLSPTAGIDGGDERVPVDVAVLDTGIQANHPDLNVVGGRNFATGKSYGDGHGHGTHVAGTIGALDNGIGVVGVAPGARLWAVRVLDNNGTGWLSWILAGVDWVTANASKIGVANMSLGFAGTSAALNTAIANSVAAGVTYVVAAGNDGADAGGFSPASHPDVICVSAIADTDGRCGGAGGTSAYGADDTLAAFSNRGSAVDLAAPGVGILSTYKGSAYAVLNGTSMASPHVAGAAALVIARDGRIGPANVKAALLSRAVPQSQSCDTSGSVGGFSGDSDGFAEPLLHVGGL